MPYSRWLPENINKLGLSGKAVKYIIITHGHTDHAAGAQYLQSQFQSEVIMTKEDFALTKIRAQNSRGDKKFIPPNINHFAKDGQVITSGQMNIHLLQTPGHTQGRLSLDFTVRHKGTPYRAFVMCGNGVNFTGLEQARRYVNSVQRIKKLAKQTPKIKVNLASHPRMNQLFERKDSIKHLDVSNPFVSHSGFMYFINRLEKRGAKKLAAELSKK